MSQREAHHLLFFEAGGEYQHDERLRAWLLSCSGFQARDVVVVEQFGQRWRRAAECDLRGEIRWQRFFSGEPCAEVAQEGNTSCHRLGRRARLTVEAQMVEPVTQVVER